MKHLLTLLLTTLTLTAAHSQNYRWAHGFGTPNYNSQGTSIATDAQGNVYVTGVFYDSIDFDPSTTGTAVLPTTGPAMFIAKYDSAGMYQWAFSLLNYSNYGTPHLAVNATGLYITGCFGLTTDFDPSAAVANLTANYADIFLAKYDLNGNYVWAINMGGPQDDAPNSIAIDNAGNSYITGYFKDTADFDSGGGVANLSANGIWNIFIAKYDPNGNYVWAHGFGEGSIYNGGKGIVVDQTGVVISGLFTDTIDFDPGIGTSLLYPTNGGMFLAKYDLNGNYIWAFGINASCSGVAIELSTSNLIITGGFTGTIDFDPGIGIYNAIAPNGVGTMYFAKYDAGGNFLSVKYSSDHVAGGAVTSMITDVNNNIYIAGFFAGTSDFDLGNDTSYLTSGSNFDIDIFFAKYNSLGDYIYAKSLGSTYTDKALGLSLDNLGNQYITGFFTNSTDFDPDTANATISIPTGNESIFLAKYSNSITNIKNFYDSERNVLLIFPNPANEYINLNFLSSCSNCKNSLQIMDVTGRVLFSNSDFYSKSIVDVKNLSSGMYLLTIKSKKYSTSQIFIKQ